MNTEHTCNVCACAFSDMVLVPREPTREMVAAGDFVLFEASLSDGDGTFGGDAIDTYRAMLSAAPKVTT